MTRPRRRTGSASATGGSCRLTATIGTACPARVSSISSSTTGERRAWRATWCSRGSTPAGLRRPGWRTTMDSSSNSRSRTGHNRAEPPLPAAQFAPDEPRTDRSAEGNRYFGGANGPPRFADLVAVAAAAALADVVGVCAVVCRRHKQRAVSEDVDIGTGGAAPRQVGPLLALDLVTAHGERNRGRSVDDDGYII